ncbi:Gfo/Idh/MocA family protein [Primorskyibacter marinus]|uniref:Gfo/Idh/MocA family protein n=1 Tax=Primorskyibacter marinus TaxID=1977320 RepID=UPI000E301362|nr:Gfo/Idh/MocA family oxidoreductase [Primorskyibacter marinus]
MSDTVTYGIIGCGMMGQEHLRNIALLSGARVGAVFEPDRAMREVAALLAPSAVFPETLEDLLAVGGVDCLLIASPNHLHVPQLELIAAKRPLPLLIEKPLFTNPADAERVTEICAAYPAPVWVAMEYRYMPPIAALLKQVDAATGGVRMLTIREHRFAFLKKVGDWNRFNRYSGGTLVEKCCHFFDLMRLVIPSDPVRVMASAGQATNHLDETYGGETPDIWDHGYVIVEFANGARAMLELCMFAEGSRYQEEISAVGPAGKIECLVPGPGRFWPADLGAPPVPQLIVSPRSPKGPMTLDIPVDPQLLEAGDHNGSTYYQHQKFREAVLGNAPPEVTVKDGHMAVRLGLAAQLSASTGQSVDL